MSSRLPLSFLLVLAECVLAALCCKPGPDIQVTIAEDLPVGSIVAQTFVDDAGTSDCSSYTLEDSCEGVFIIDANGFIRLAKPIQQTSTPWSQNGGNCSLSVMGGLGSRGFSFVYQAVNVHLNTTSDAPNMGGNLLKTTTDLPVMDLSVQVYENLPTGSVIANFKDLHRFPPQTVFSVYGSSRNTFKVTQDGSLVLYRSLDREMQSEIFVPISAVHLGVPFVNSTFALHVSVMDVNDNAPIFLQSMWVLPINATTGYITPITLKAADMDGPGRNSRILYNIEGAPPELMKVVIDHDRGDLTQTALLTPEEMCKADGKTLVVVATDAGDVRLSSYTNVEVHVQGPLVCDGMTSTGATQTLTTLTTTAATSTISTTGSGPVETGCDEALTNVCRPLLAPMAHTLCVLHPDICSTCKSYCPTCSLCSAGDSGLIG